MAATLINLQVNTNVQQAGPNQFFLLLEHAESINHIVVFLTGEVGVVWVVGGGCGLGDVRVM